MQPAPNPRPVVFIGRAEEEFTSFENEWFELEATELGAIW